MNEYVLIINVVWLGSIIATISVDAEYQDAVIDVINLVVKDFSEGKLSGHDVREEIYERLHNEIGMGFSDITDDTAVFDLDAVQHAQDEGEAL